MLLLVYGNRRGPWLHPCMDGWLDCVWQSVRLDCVYVAVCVARLCVCGSVCLARLCVCGSVCLARLCV